MTKIEKLTKKIAEDEKKAGELKLEIRSAIDDDKATTEDVKEKMGNLDALNEGIKKDKDDLSILQKADESTQESKKDDAKVSEVKPSDKKIENDSGNEKQTEKRDDEEDVEERDLKGLKMTKAKVTETAEAKGVKAFEEFLKTGETRDVTGLQLTDGAVIIPEAILPVEKETYQFPRLGSLVRTVSVATTTGKLPVFMNSTDSLNEHTEYAPTAPNAKPDIKPILWDLKSYTGAYLFSQELISDSSYNWEAELQGRLTELRDNTDDKLIMSALTDGVTPVSSKDIIADLKTALNVTLKPNDSAEASIVLSQSAYNELDQLKDGEGRPMLQPSITNASGMMLLGKQVVVIEDTLFPNAKMGDTNIIVAPLKKAVINFKLTEITGQFQDTYDIWYKQLGIFLREDVIQARKDLIINIKATEAPVETKSKTK
ncbi:phage major capsid protein [Weissella coleopterorum]|uniref:Phage major capsid protein n=1 Tax=Weissella coleopterorum TaxID=2714949 RepID=A0A6G8AY05_9LACO|nr:phage major capsid protein [Weissella coleopterorum]QIL49860.1 phage major capsid protein [Weissella coleopterorum]